MCFRGNKDNTTEYIENIHVKIILEVAKARVKEKIWSLKCLYYIIIKRKLLNNYPILPKNFEKEQNKTKQCKTKEMVKKNEKQIIEYRNFENLLYKKLAIHM